MHLNNRGWGTHQMIMMTCFLLLMLAIAWYNIVKLYNGSLIMNNESIKNEYYEIMSSDLMADARRYYFDNDYSGQAILTYNLLKNASYITNNDKYINKNCNGYVTVNNEVFKPYLRCDDYKTEGYINDFE